MHLYNVSNKNTIILGKLMTIHVLGKLFSAKYLLTYCFQSFDFKQCLLFMIKLLHNCMIEIIFSKLATVLESYIFYNVKTGFPYPIHVEIPLI